MMAVYKHNPVQPDFSAHSSALQLKATSFFKKHCGLHERALKTFFSPKEQL